jgi:hypothetical protein
MPSQEKARIQAVLLTNTGNLALKVLSLGKSRMLVRTPQPVKLPSNVRVGFAHRGDHKGRILMLAQVSSVQVETGTTLIKLEYKALHSMDGKECITEFVRTNLGHEQLDERAFRFGRGGWFYQLKAEPTAAGSKQEDDGASQRREERIPVRIPLMYAFEGDAFKAEAYNISFNGLFLLTESRLPPNGSELDVTFPILQGSHMQKVFLSGKVCWVGAGMSSADGGGIGLLIQSWTSDADHSLWRAFVQREIEFGTGRR